MDLFDTLSLAAMFAVRDYYNEKDRIKSEYARSKQKLTESIADSVIDFGNAVVAILDGTNGRCTEAVLAEGMSVQPLYLWRKLMVSSGYIAEYQEKMITLYFNSTKVKLCKSEFEESVKTENNTSQYLEGMCGVSRGQIGSFWQEIIEAVSVFDGGMKNLEKAVKACFDMTAKFEALGESSGCAYRTLCSNFAESMDFWLEKYGRNPSSVASKHIQNAADDMKYIFNRFHYIAKKAGDEDEIDVDDTLFQLYQSLLFILMLQSDGDIAYKKRLLEFMFSTFMKDSEASADSVINTAINDKTFIESMRDMPSAILVVIAIMAQRAGNDDFSKDITSHLIDYMREVERACVVVFPDSGLGRMADEVMSYVLDETIKSIENNIT